MRTNCGSGPTQGAWSWPLTSIYCMEVYIQCPLWLRGMVHQMPLMFSISWIVWKIFPWLYLFSFLVVCGFELYSLCFITLWSSGLLHHAVYYVHLFQHFRGTCCLHLQVGLNLVQVGNEVNVLPNFFIIQCGLQKVKSWFCHSVARNIFPSSLWKGGIYISI